MNIQTVEGEVGTYTWEWACPEGRIARINWLHCIYISNGTAGTRQIVLQLLNASDTLLMDTHAGATQITGLTRHYLFLPGIYREAAFVDGEIEVAIPARMIVPAGYKLKLFDTDGIVAGDAIGINFQYEDIAY